MLFAEWLIDGRLHVFWSSVHSDGEESRTLLAIGCHPGQQTLQGHSGDGNKAKRSAVK